MEKERAREEVRRKYRGKVEKILQNKQSKEQERQRLLKEKREELEDRLENKRTLKKKQQRERMLKNKERKRKYQEKLRKVDLNREKIRRQMSEKKERKNVELFKTISKTQEIIVENANSRTASDRIVGNQPIAVPKAAEVMLTPLRLGSR